MTITCTCGTRNDDGALFCRSASCGLLLEWSVPPSEDAGGPGVGGTQREGNGGASPGAQAATAVQASPREPGPEYEPPPEYSEVEVQELPEVAGQLLCSKPGCGKRNWPHAHFCRHCGTVLQRSAVVAPPARLPRLLAWFRREKDPLPAGQRKRPRKPILGRDPVILLRTSLKVLAIVLIVAAACIGGLWVWNSTLQPRVVGWYASSREALFPRFRPDTPDRIYYVVPNLCVSAVRAKPASQASVRAGRSRIRPIGVPPKGQRPCYPISSTHSVADIFDKNVNTFWLSPTRLGANDLIVVRFEPEVNIAAFTIYAGDPTGAQLVPKNIQMTFYGPAETVYYPPPVEYPAPEKDVSTLPSTKKRLYWPVMAVREWTLLDTQAEQRFSTGDRTNIARVVITIRGHYANTNPSAKQALTEIAFFDKY